MLLQHIIDVSTSCEVSKYRIDCISAKDVLILSLEKESKSIYQQAFLDLKFVMS